MTAPQMRLVGDWDRARLLVRKHRSGLLLQRAFSRAVAQEANEFRKEVLQGIRKQAPGGQKFAPLHPLTIAKKRSSKALIDTGALVQSIAVDRIDRFTYFVGVNRKARHKGRPLANIAELHEKGATIVQRITPAMFHWFMSFLRSQRTRGGRQRRIRGKGMSARGGARPSFRPGATLVVNIPARPFMQPVYDKLYGSGGQAVAARIMARVAVLLGGDFGYPTFGGLAGAGRGGGIA